MKFISNLTFYSVSVGIIIVLGIIVYNPKEKAQIKLDQTRQDSIQVLARGLVQFQKEHQRYPNDNDCDLENWITSCLVEKTIINSPPQSANLDKKLNCHSQGGYCYIISGEEVFVLTRLNSLKYTQRCFGDDKSYFAFFSDENKSGIMCMEDIEEINETSFAL